MARPRLGAAVRSSPVTARLLTHLRVSQLRRSAHAGDLWQFAKHSRPGTLTVDVGASVGNYALASAMAVGRRGRVIALEPNPGVFSELVNSTWGAPVTPLNLAASNVRGVASLSVPTGPSGTAVPPLGSLESRAGGHHSYDVRTVLLDDLIPPGREVSVLKIDVEGHELRVLEGAEEVLGRWRPAIVVEIEQRHLIGLSVRDVAHWLFDRGYEAWGIRGHTLLPWSEFDQFEWQDRWITPMTGGGVSIESDYVNNFLFLPRDATVSGV